MTSKVAIVEVGQNARQAFEQALRLIGGIDLAVLDGTHATFKSKRIDTNILIVGRDAVAVETAGATIVGMNPEKMPIIQQAVRRALGEGDIKKIKVLGASIQSIKEKLGTLSKASKKKLQPRKRL